MERAIYMILGMVMLAIASGAAQEIEIPEDAPRETWQMIYDDYRFAVVGKTEAAQYENLTKDITVVRGDDCIYIQGIAKACPESWVKATIAEDTLGSKLLLWSNQSVSGTTSGVQYLNTGKMMNESGDGHTYVYYGVECQPSTSPLIFLRDFSKDEVVYQPDYRGAYWIQDKPNQQLEVIVMYSWWTDEDGTEYEFVTGEFDDQEIYVNPRLVDKMAGIEGLREEDDESAPIYTTSGVKADREHLMPGVYVSRGKKIIIK